MLKYMETKYGERATRGNKAALQNIKNEVQRLEAQLAAQMGKNAAASDKSADRNSEDETDEDVSNSSINQLSIG
jgi:F0F1-type ATP synthase membrane subunit b/b'